MSCSKFFVTSVSLNYERKACRLDLIDIFWVFSENTFYIVHFKPQLKYTMLYNTWKHFKSSSHHLKLFFPSLHPWPHSNGGLKPGFLAAAFWDLNLISDRVLECLIWSRKDLWQSMLVHAKSRHPSFQVTCWLLILSNHSTLLTPYFKTTYLQFHLRRESGVLLCFLLLVVVIVFLMIHSSM